MKGTVALAAVVLAGVIMPMTAHADHHGRGNEQLNGFPGIYNVGPGRATFTDDGYLVMVSGSSNVAVNVMTYAVTDGVMTLQDISPPAFFPPNVRACLRENTATYAMVDEDNGFTLAVRDDPCPQRARLFNEMRFIDYVRPEAE